MPELIWSKDDDPTLVKTVLMRVCIHPPWIGQIREVYEIDWDLGPGEKSYFLIVKADITRAQYDLIVPYKKLKVKLLDTDGGFLSDKSLQEYLRNKKKNLDESVARYSVDGKQPKLEIKMDFCNTQKTMICNAPKAWQPLTPEEMDALPKPLLK